MLKGRNGLRFLRIAYRFISTDHRPELDFDYVLDPRNKEEITRNIINRKQVGNLDAVYEIWGRLNLIMCHQDASAELCEDTLKNLWDSLYSAVNELPNNTHPSTPIGDESANCIVETYGKAPEFKDFQPRTAEEIGIRYRSLRTDIRHACGNKSYALVGPLARIEDALVKLALNKLRKLGFTLIWIPDILNAEVPHSCGLMSRSERGILYRLKASPEWCLSGTGEMGIASFLAGNLLNSYELPKKFVAVSRCYRPEVYGGRIQHGLYRVHEFTKVEMFGVTRGDTEESEEMLKYIVSVQTEFFSSLNLHFRLMEMSSQELGAAAYRKFDVEAWMPGRKIFGEISSASNCTDYQSRRLNIRYRDTETDKLKFVHTVNGTACATTRLLIALLETHQQYNWSLKLPVALQELLADDHGERKILKMKSCDPRTRFSIPKS